MGDEADRDAILRRRRQLIALALSGLTGAACEGEPPERAPPVKDEVTEAPMEPVAIDEGLEPPPEEPPEAATAPDPVPDPVPDQAEIRHAEERKRRLQRPQPCLTPPSVCLSVAPRVCLFMEKPDDGYEP